MKSKNKILIITLVTISIALIIFLTSPLDSQTIPISFITSQNPGFDLTPDQINFGKIIPGYSATRQLTIQNNYQYPTTTKIKSSGKISPYIIVSENNFRLETNQSKNITLTALPTEDLELKEYSGKITIITTKA